jgi:hypothetical protein
VGGGALAPTFEYRGFFVNDEDMLAGFAADPLGEAVFSVHMWNKVYGVRFSAGFCGRKSFSSSPPHACH